MAVTVETVKASIDALSANLNSNVFVVSAREAFRDGINEYEISDEEKAKLIAQYEAQVSIGIMGHIINLAREIPQVDAQVNLLAQQKLTEVEQTAKVAYEHKTLMPSQKAQVDAQVNLLAQQKLTEVEQTAKVAYEHKTLMPSQKAQVDAQVNLLAQQKLTEVEQTAKVAYEHKTLMPSQKAQVDAQVNLLAQQKLTEVEQTAKVAYEHKTLMPSQKAQVDAQKTLLIEQEKTQAKQTLKVGYESMETKARTSKNYGFNVTESSGVFSASDMKNGMIDKQIISEMWRHRDMKAGVLLKNKSVYTTLKNAKFEEARTHIAIKANQDNMYLKKADFKVNQLNAMAVDEDYIIEATQIADVKNTIDSIPTTALTYTSDISTTFSEVEITDITL